MGGALCSECRDCSEETTPGVAHPLETLGIAVKCSSLAFGASSTGSITLDLSFHSRLLRLRQSWELAFPLRPRDRVPEFVCDSGATLKEKSDGKLLAGNRVNVREVTRCFPQLPLCAHLAAGNV